MVDSLVLENRCPRVTVETEQCFPKCFREARILLLNRDVLHRDSFNSSRRSWTERRQPNCSHEEKDESHLFWSVSHLVVVALNFRHVALSPVNRLGVKHRADNEIASIASRTTLPSCDKRRWREPQRIGP